MVGREAAGTNFHIFCMTWPGFEPSALLFYRLTSSVPSVSVRLKMTAAHILNDAPQTVGKHDRGRDYVWFSHLLKKPTLPDNKTDGES